MPPKPGKQVKLTIETSGNRHQVGAQRVKLKLDLTLTVEPAEAEAMALALHTEDESALSDELLEILALVKQLAITTTRKRKQTVNALRHSAYDARLGNWFSGTEPCPEEPEDL